MSTNGGERPKGRVGLRAFAARFWKQIVALGVVGAVVGYVVTLGLDEGSERIGGVLNGREAALVAEVLHPGDYQAETFYSPMYIVDSVPPEKAPVELLGLRDGEFYAWQRERGGTIGQEQTFRVVLRGRDTEPTIINGITASVIDRGDPASGWFTHRRGCGDVPVREALIDLDRDPPTITFSNVDPEAPADTRLTFTKQVTSEDVEVIDVVAKTTESLVHWRLEVLYIAGGERGTLIIDDDGEPFEVSALTPGRAEFYRSGIGPLEREPESDPGENGMPFC